MIELSSNPLLLADTDDNPYDRLGGWENELGYTSKPKLVAATVPLPQDFEWQPRLLGFVPPDELLVFERDECSYFDIDGFHRYIDVGDHPESSTPEHINYLDLAYSSLYGVVEMGRTLGRAADKMRGFGLDPGIVITANNTDPLGNVWATHHNLITRRGLGFQYIKDALIAHYVSRIVWAGAGAPIQNTIGKYKFGLSARADHIWDEISSHTTTRRPFINTRDKPYADGKYFRRLHGINGEMVFSPQVLAAVMATESIILRACELGARFDDLVPLNPIQAIRQVSHDPTLQQTILIKGKKEAQPESVTAIELQRALLNRALSVAEKGNYLTAQEKKYGKIVNHYLDLLENLDQNRDECKRLFDWVYKQELLDKYVARPREKKMTDYEVAWAAMLAFHRVYPDEPKEGLGLSRLRKGMYVDGPPDKMSDVLDNRPELPPTRAAPRANALRVINERPNLCAHGDWDELKVDELTPNGDIGRRIGSAALHDPYATQFDDLDRLTREALAWAA